MVSVLLGGASIVAYHANVWSFEETVVFLLASILVYVVVALDYVVMAVEDLGDGDE
jgi:hypothetical protein